MPASKEQKKDDLAINVELGVPNVSPATSWVNWAGSGSVPLGSYAVGRDSQAPTQAELVFMVRHDGQARAMLNLLTLPIKAAFARSKWVTPEPGEGEEETDFANQMWTLPYVAGGMKTPVSLFLKQTLLALPYGFSAFEIVRRVPEEGPLAGKVTIEKMGYRDPRTVTFLTNDHGEYQGFQQITNFANRYINAIINKDDSWVYSSCAEENPMYGISLFEPAYQHFQMKRKLYYISDLAAQLAAVPGRIGELPLGATPRQIQEFKQGLANFSFNNSMIVPPNFKVTPFNSNSNFDFITLVSHHNMMMATSILAKFLQQEDRQVLIDNGKADASADMFVAMLEAITAELAESWTNTLMPQFIDYNFGTGVYPVFKFAPLTDDNKQAIQQLFEAMVAQPVLNATPEFMRDLEKSLAERLGFEIDYEEVAKEEEQAAQEQKALQATAQKAQAKAQVQQAQIAQDQSSQQPGTQIDQNSNEPATVPNVGSQRPPKRKADVGPASAGPVVKASATLDDQQDAMSQIASALSVLFTDEDIPSGYSYEPEVIPEA